MKDLIPYPFTWREGLTSTLDIPSDVTPGEIERACVMLKTLPVDAVVSSKERKDTL